MEKQKNSIDRISDGLINDLSSEDRISLEQWSASHPDHEKLLGLLNSIELSPRVIAKGEEMRSTILLRLNKKIDKAIRRKVWLKIVSVAASIAILVGMTSYLSFQQGYKQLNSQPIELSNPLGMKSTVTLPDGSKVILNAGTTLIYPTAFVKSEREVRVRGEAFFEVVHDSKRPYYVKTGDVKVKVLGTKFNVKAYDDDRFIEVTLTEGSVDVGWKKEKQDIRLQPGQLACFDKVAETSNKREVDLNFHTAWKDGKFYFDGLTFESIAKQLERNFNVHIHIASDKLKSTVFTGDFVRGENLEQILHIMTLDKRIHYKIEGNQVYISEK